MQLVSLDARDRRRQTLCSIEGGLQGRRNPPLSRTLARKPRKGCRDGEGKEHSPQEGGGIQGAETASAIARSSQPAAQPHGRTITADALVAGAGAAAAVLVRDRDEAADAARTGVRKGGRAIATMTEAVDSAADAVWGVISDAARSALPEPEKDRKRPAARRRRDEGETTRH